MDTRVLHLSIDVIGGRRQQRARYAEELLCPSSSGEPSLFAASRAVVDDSSSRGSSRKSKC